MTKAATEKFWHPTDDELRALIVENPRYSESYMSAALRDRYGDFWWWCKDHWLFDHGTSWNAQVLLSSNRGLSVTGPTAKAAIEAMYAQLDEIDGIDPVSPTEEPK